MNPFKMDYFDKNHGWLIQSEDYSFTERDFNYYQRYWRSVFRDSVVHTNDNILCVNDCFQLFANSVSVPCSTTVLDPLAYKIIEEPFASSLCLTPYKYHVDTLGKVHKKALVDETFKQALDDGMFKSKYDVICVHARTADEVSYKNVEKYFTLLCEYGILCIQIDKTLYTHETEILLNHYFSLLLQNSRPNYFKTSTQLFLTYNKISGLV